MFSIEVKGHDSSDCGFYGKTGTFPALDLPTKECPKCNQRPSINCHYDDTPGARDTRYRLICKCDKDYSTTSMQLLLKWWNCSHNYGDKVDSFLHSYYRKRPYKICDTCEYHTLDEPGGE